MAGVIQGLLFFGFLAGAVMIMRWQGAYRVGYRRAWLIWTGYTVIGLAFLIARKQAFDAAHLWLALLAAPLLGAVLALRSFRAVFYQKK